MQSMHWHSYQITILVHITWMRNPNPNPHDESTNTIMKYYFYVSNDKSHNSYFVQHYLRLHSDDVVNNNNKPIQHWIWSDGYSSQFKNKLPWYIVVCYPYISSGCICLWNFFGSY